MTPALMPLITRARFIETPREDALTLRAWLANKLQIILGNLDLESRDERLPLIVRTNVRTKARAVELLMEEFDEIFGLK